MWLDNVQALSQMYRVYAVDTPGDIGKSLPTRLPGRRQDYAIWLIDVIDQLQLNRVNLIGFSYGGFLAANFAIAYPHRVKRAALLAPGIPNFGPPTLSWAYYGMPMLLFPSRFMVKRFINAASVKGYTAGNPVQEQMLVSVPHLRERNFLKPSFSDQELRQVYTPCLLLLGNGEILYEPLKAAARACRLITNLETQIIPNAGHMLNSDQPEAVNDHLLKFLKDSWF
jgi:pimeloyl-ACP methyl ester carboxylesterase